MNNGINPTPYQSYWSDDDEIGKKELQDILDGLDMLATFSKDKKDKERIEKTRKRISSKIDKATDKIPDSSEESTWVMNYRIISRWPRQF